MAIPVSDEECRALEPHHAREDPEYDRWTDQLKTLPASTASIREASLVALDGLRMRHLQLLCEPIYVRSVRENATAIFERRVFLAEIDSVHVGFCISSPGGSDSDPLFVRVIAVAPAARRRGIGMALLTAAAKREPRRDIALATQLTNAAARSLNDKFADSIGASIKRVNLGTYRDRDLGITRGDGYRAWFIERPRPSRLLP